MSMEDAGPIVIYPWDRKWNIGPTDSHLHVIGQISCNYSIIERLIHEIFLITLGGDKELGPQLVHELKINTGNEPNFIKARLSKDGAFHKGASSAILVVINDWPRLKKIRQTVIHWQSQIETPNGSAIFTNAIKQNVFGDSTIESFSLEALRSYANEPALAIEHLSIALIIISMPPDEPAKLLDAIESQQLLLENHPQYRRLIDMIRHN